MEIKRKKNQAYREVFSLLGDYYAAQTASSDSASHRSKLKAIALYNMALATGRVECDMGLNEHQRDWIGKIKSIDEDLLDAVEKIPAKQSINEYWQEMVSFKKILVGIRQAATEKLEGLSVDSRDI